MKRFILVTAVVCIPGDATNKASGIKKLRRGVDLHEFIKGYMLSLGIHEFETLDRDQSTVVMKTAGEKLCSWYFTEYQESELFDTVAHLTREELLRDLKELLPLKETV